MRRFPHAAVLMILVAVFTWGLPPSPAGADTVLAPNPHVPRGPGLAPERCVDVMFLGFRGSGEHPRGRTRTGSTSSERPVPWSADDFTVPDTDRQRTEHGTSAADDRLGPTLGALYEALRRRVSQQGRTVGFWSVGVDDSPGFGYGALYRAPPVDVANLAQYLTSMSLDSLAIGLGRELESLFIGGNGRPPHCPGTSVVVAGFSQGAVVARAVVLTLQERLQRAGRTSGPVRDVVLIGDPLFRRGEHRTHGVVHPSDHQVDGLLRIDLVRLCDRTLTTRMMCAFTAMGTTSARTWFREVWRSLGEFARLHPRLLQVGAAAIERGGTRVHLVCDSGDVVCSPLRVVTAVRWDSDFPELFMRRPERTIHGSYGRTVPWDAAVGELDAVGLVERRTTPA